MISSNPKPRLLLVEDHAQLSLWVGKALRQRGVDIEFATGGRQAARMLREEAWDVVVLDLSLPDIDGLDVLRELRQRGDSVPVLILTARSDVSDRVRGLNLGADDYLAKPFDLTELEARIAALMRRPKDLRARIASIGDLTLDREQNAFYCDGTALALTRRENHLLRVLFDRAGHVVTKDFLHQAVFSDSDATLDAIEVNVYRLRKKVPPCGVRIATVRGLGYMLERVS